MAAPNSRGFDLNVMPISPQVDARLFSTGGQLGAGLNSGLATVGALRNIYDAAAASSPRRRLQEIQLSNAEQQAGILPIELARRRVELAQPIQNVTGYGIETVGRPALLQPMVDETGAVIVDESGNPRMESPASASDVFSTETVREIDPTTGAVRVYQRRGKPISTAEQLAQQASLIDSREASALAAQERNRVNLELGTLKAENDRIKADAMAARAEAALADPKWRVTGSSVDANGNMVINQVSLTDGTLRQIPTGQKPRSNTAIFGGLNLYGNQGGGVSQPVANAAGAIASIDPDIQRLSDQLSGTRVPVAITAPRVFNTVQEAEAAAAAKQIFPGDKITVAGRSATWQ